MPASICPSVRRGVLLFVMLMLPLTSFAKPCQDWPLWQTFSSRLIQSDGRVLADESEQRYSTSEGQAYALFFSLVADDRDTFDRIRVWTRDNLAAGDFAARLPAWQWGKRADGSWGVVDQNSASDADVWLAYTLLEAGRLWNEPRYTAQGKLMLTNIRIHEIRDLNGAGEMLMPAPLGFDLEAGGARLNPSYLPLQLFRAFSRVEPSGPWNRIINNSLKFLKSSSTNGFVADWVAYVPSKGYSSDPVSGWKGSHDAIRVYMWWGMLYAKDPVAMRLKKAISGMNRLIPKRAIIPPLNVDINSAEISGVSPLGFSAALLPYFSAMGNKEALRLQHERLLANQEKAEMAANPRYYDQVLSLFGLGWIEHRFSFSSQGQLVVPWKQSCSAEI